ncbi:MAG: response regulator [Ruminococcus sp.]|jgi:PAS domain S-box-containing protein|nr:response regulator [Ruminococcus sp.]
MKSIDNKNLHVSPDLRAHHTITPEYKFGNNIGRIGVLLYGVLRLIEPLITGNPIANSLKTFGLCVIATVLVTIVQIIMRGHKATPLVTGILIMSIFIIGAYITQYFVYYYISLLCVVGIVSVYQNFKMLIAFFCTALAVNLVLYFTIFLKPEIAAFNEMVLGGLLCFYGFFFLTVLCFRSSVKEGVAQRGLHSFSSMLSTTPDMMVIVDDQKKVQYLSKPLADLAEIEPVLAIGRPLLDLFADRELKLMLADIMDTDGFYSQICEIKLHGESRWFRVICDSLQGDVKGIFINISDITSTVEAKNLAEEAMKQAKTANESKSRFLATMSHEIRTPMNGIIGISQMIMGRSDVTPELNAQIERIYSSGHSLLGIINDILDLSKIESGNLDINPSDYDLPSLINDSVQLNMYRIGSKAIDFSLYVDEYTPAHLLGDELRIKQILNNVLSNAFKYTDSGSVKMYVSHELVDPETSEIDLIFRVEDTGQGMKEEDVNNLFSEYSRFNSSANRNTEGTGLGMNITWRLVNMMNGSIDVKSVFGKGSTFTIRIKQTKIGLTEIGPELSEKLSNFTFSRERQSEKLQIRRENMPYGSVLVVDDVETNLFVAEGLMKPYNLKIKLVKSGFEALDLIKSGESFDVIFMDHMMPQMDGIETTVKIREFGYTGTIVALTANAVSGASQMFINNGFDDFISKPIDLRNLNSALNKFVRDKYRTGKTYTENTYTETTDSEVGKEIRKKLITFFINDARSAIESMESSAEKADWKLFAISAHGMKSSCANVGNNTLSEAAKLLEFAGKSGNDEIIKKELPSFIQGLKKFIETLKNEAAESKKKADTDAPDLLKTLSEIASACDNYDETIAEPLISILEKASFEPPIAEKIMKISELIMFAEFEDAANLCREICGEIVMA